MQENALIINIYADVYDNIFVRKEACKNAQYDLQHGAE